MPMRLCRPQVNYWRSPNYNVLRALVTIVIGIVFGTLFLNRGEKRCVCSAAPALLEAPTAVSSRTSMQAPWAPTPALSRACPSQGAL
jgi:hypothetical protein